MSNRATFRSAAFALAVVLAGAGLLAGCTTATPTVEEAPPAPPTAIAVTPEATEAPTSEVAVAPWWCAWASPAAAAATTEKPLNFTCDTGDPELQVGLFGNIENTDLGWMIAAGQLGADGATPAEGELTMLTVDYIELEDGTQCANAGHGATTGYDDKRLNYTCDSTTGEQLGLFGDVAVTDAGWQITEATFSITPGGPTVTAPTTVTIKALGVPPLPATE